MEDLKSRKKVLLTRPLPAVQSPPIQIIKRKTNRKNEIKLPTIGRYQDCTTIPTKKRQIPFYCNDIIPKVDQAHNNPDRRSNYRNTGRLFDILHLRDISNSSYIETTENNVYSRYNYKQIQKRITDMAWPHVKRDISYVTIDYGDVPPVYNLVPDYQQLCTLATVVKWQFDSLNIPSKVFVRKTSEISNYYPYYYFANFVNCNIKQPSTSSNPQKESERKIPDLGGQTELRTPNISASTYPATGNRELPLIRRQTEPKHEPVEPREANQTRPELGKFGTRSTSPFGQMYGTSKQSPAELTVLCTPPSQTSLSLQGFFIGKMPVANLSTNLVHLNLSYNNFKEIPNCVLDLVSLEMLCLRSNPIDQIPASIGQLVNLKWLDASFCQITKISKKLYCLANIERLWLSYNKLAYISPAVSKLRNLKELHLEANDLIGLPLSMHSMSIEALNVRGNMMHPLFARETLRPRPNRLVDMCMTQLAQQWEGLGTEFLEESEACAVCERLMFGSGNGVITFMQTCLSDKPTPFLLSTCSLPCRDYLTSTDHGIDFVVDRMTNGN